MGVPMGDGTAASAIKYLDYLIEKGRATNGAINPLKIAFTKVMETIDGKDGWQAVQVRNVDVDDYMNRFGNLTLGKYSSDSLTVYKSRVKKVVEWYIRFLDNPGWTPEIQRRNRSGSGSRQGIVTSLPVPPAPSVTPMSAETSGLNAESSADVSEAAAPQASAPISVQPAPSQPVLAPATPAIPSNPDRVVYPFPLSDGQLVHISLPFNLGKTDAKRIGAFVESIARDDA